jgi:hypothetical protein
MTFVKISNIFEILNYEYLFANLIALLKLWSREIFNKFFRIINYLFSILLLVTICLILLLLPQLSIVNRWIIWRHHWSWSCKTWKRWTWNRQSRAKIWPHYVGIHSPTRISQLLSPTYRQTSNQRIDSTAIKPILFNIMQLILILLFFCIRLIEK